MQISSADTNLPPVDGSAELSLCLWPLNNISKCTSEVHFRVPHSNSLYKLRKLYAQNGVLVFQRFFLLGKILSTLNAFNSLIPETQLHFLEHLLTYQGLEL